MKMEHIECFETSAHKIQTPPADYQEENMERSMLFIMIDTQSSSK